MPGGWRTLAHIFGDGSLSMSDDRMKREDSEDEAFDELLRSVARTPDVAALRRDFGAGSELVNRFVIGRQLGEGGMGRVFAAFDRQRQVKVAIKTLGVLTPHSIVALKREFRSAAELSHPNLVRLHELFNDSEEWFFSMELLEGRTLRALLVDRPGDIDLIRRVFRQLASALAELHQAGTLHGDLKPSNFLVVGAEHRAVLLDFGVSRPLNPDPRERSFAGTREYSAPEQIAGGTISEAADWYAFGVVLFEALTGKLPRRADFDHELRRAPAELSVLCRQLLQANPETRATGTVVRRALGVAELPFEPLGSWRPSVPNQLFGRSAELETLFHAYSRVSAEHPAVVLVQGDSGIGKTALVEVFSRELAQRGAVVFSARCRERETASYNAVDGLIDDLVRYLDQLPSERAAALLPDGIEELTRIFPALRTASVVAMHADRTPRNAEPDQAALKQHAILAFHDLFAAIASDTPLVLCIDDLQWSDVQSAELLAPMLSQPKAAAVMLVGSSRSIAGGHGSTIDSLYAQGGATLPNPQVIQLAPLAPDASESLARELLAKDAETQSLAREIAREAAGSPLFIAELVHHFGVQPAGTPSTTNQTLAQLILTRVAALPADARQLLEVIAVAGIPLSRSAARRSSDLTANSAEEAIDFLRFHQLARSHGSLEQRSIEMQHDRIREIVLQSIPLALKSRLHLRLAQALEAEPTVQPEIVAGHFFAADQVQNAGRYWIKAADAAFEALAFGRAAELYQRGESLAGLAPPAVAALQVRRAEALAHDGKGAIAADVYLLAAEEHERDQAIELRRRAAEQLLLSGHLDRGLAVIGVVLRDLGMRTTRTGRRVIPSILMGRILVRMQGLRFTIRKASEISQRDLIRVDASWSIACSLGVLDFMRGADFQNDHLLLALKAGEPRRLLRALTLEISYSATPGLGAARRTEKLLAMAEELAKTVDDAATRGLVRVSRGVAAYLNGRFREALVECQAGLADLRRYAGTVWETVTGQRFVVASLFHLGRFAELAELVPPLLTQADAKGNLYASTYFRSTYGNAAWLCRDQVTVAREHLAVARDQWRASGTQLPHCWMLLGEAQLAFYAGETEGLWHKLEREWQRMRAAQFFRIGMIRVQLWYLRASVALREAHAHAQAGRARESRRFSHEARRSAKQLGAQHQTFAKPLSELMLAGVAIAALDNARARLHLQASIEQFDREDMRLYAAAARVRLGEISQGDAGAELVRTGVAAFEAEGVASVSRCVAMLAPLPPTPQLLGPGARG